VRTRGKAGASGRGGSAPTPGPSRLSRRERSVLERRRRGDTLRTIAAELLLAPSSVAVYERRALAKLGVETVAEAATSSQLRLETAAPAESISVRWRSETASVR